MWRRHVGRFSLPHWDLPLGVQGRGWQWGFKLYQQIPEWFWLFFFASRSSGEDRIGKRLLVVKFLETSTGFLGCPLPLPFVGKPTEIVYFGFRFCIEKVRV